MAGADEFITDREGMDIGVSCTVASEASEIVGGMIERGVVLGGRIERGAVVGGTIDRGKVVSSTIERAGVVGGMIERGEDVGAIVAVDGSGEGVIRSKISGFTSKVCGSAIKSIVII